MADSAPERKGKRYFIVAGEASGDLHASNLIRQIKLIQADAVFCGFGGDLMEAAGMHLKKHYREMDFMGFIEVIANLRTIFKNLDYCKRCIEEFKPDAIILVDYPGFNLRIAPYAKEKGIEVIYYISPQIWAWKQDRVYKIRECVDKMLVILPFEKEFYNRFDMRVDFVGHPLLDAIAQFEEDNNTESFRATYRLNERPIIALLPGSRKQEIKRKLPVMLKMTTHFPAYQFVVAKAKSQSIGFFEELIGNADVRIIENDTYRVLQHAEAACVTSGTATLETALFNVPEVVCYKGNKLSYYIARQLIKVKFISLVNLIMDREVVKELIQNELSETNLRFELAQLLEPGKREELMLQYAELKNKLGGNGASLRAAKIITGAS